MVASPLHALICNVRDRPMGRKLSCWYSRVQAEGRRTVKVWSWHLHCACLRCDKRDVGCCQDHVVMNHCSQRFSSACDS